MVGVPIAQIPRGPACFNTGKHLHANKVHLNELCNCSYDLCCRELLTYDLHACDLW